MYSILSIFKPILQFSVSLWPILFIFWIWFWQMHFRCSFELKRSFFWELLNLNPQLLPRCMEVHCLQCKNCQYRYLWQYPSEMSNFFFLTSIYQTGWLPKQFIIVRSPDHLVLIPGGFYYWRDACNTIARKQIWKSRQNLHLSQIEPNWGEFQNTYNQNTYCTDFNWFCRDFKWVWCSTL